MNAAPPALRELGEGHYALAGDLVFETAPGLLAAGEAAFAARPAAVVDLAGVGRVDSAGLALLLEWAVAARIARRPLSYRNAPAALAALAGLGEVEALLASAGTG